MEKNKKLKFEARANVLKALAHPSRLCIVDELSKKSQCVCELREIIGDDFSTVSKHLTVLKNAGIVKDEKRGTQVYYTLKMTCVLSFFTCAEKVLKQNLEEQKKALV